MIHIATKNKPLALSGLAVTTPRYNLSSGVVVPSRTSGVVWIESTDGKALSICRARGKVTEEMWVPSGVKISANGSDVDAFPACEKNRWPEFTPLIKDAPREYLVVPVDAKLLEAVSRAISRHGTGQVGIIVPKDYDGTAPLQVFGEHGIGLICPFFNCQDNWREMLDEYREDKLAVFKAGGDINRVIDADKRGRELMDSL